MISNLIKVSSFIIKGTEEDQKSVGLPVKALLKELTLATLCICPYPPQSEKPKKSNSKGKKENRFDIEKASCLYLFNRAVVEYSLRWRLGAHRSAMSRCIGCDRRNPSL